MTGPAQRRSRLAELGDRVAGAFSPPNQRRPSGSHLLADRPPAATHAGEPAGDPPTEAWDDPPAWDDSPPRFPLARDGYDRPAVDEYVSDLEHELNALDKEIVKLREQASQPAEIKSEIERVGEQTSAILIAAHEQAQQTTRKAQEQADQCITDAAAKALAMTAEAKEELATHGQQKESLREERGRLIGDVRRLSTALATLADEADQRTAPGGQEADQPRAPEAPSA
jgi:hypothetical protein